MTTSDPTIIITNARPAKPSARRYYVWQAAMWMTILHTILVGGFTAFATGVVSNGSGRYFLRDLFDSSTAIHERVALCMIQWPYPLILAGFVLVPIAVIACCRASMGRSARGWLLGYWLTAATICVLLIGSFATLHPYHRYFIPGDYYFFDNWLNGGLAMCAIWLFPLPVTILAALLTIGAKNPPPASEAGA
jgi:hypothetical protein